MAYLLYMLERTQAFEGAVKTMLKDGVSSARVEVRLLERSRMRAGGSFNEISDEPDAYGYAGGTSP